MMCRDDKHRLAGYRGLPSSYTLSYTCDFITIIKTTQNLDEHVQILKKIEIDWLGIPLTIFINFVCTVFNKTIKCYTFSSTEYQMRV